MYLNDTACCAVQEIADLSGSVSPKEAMLCFCNQHAMDAYDDGYYDDCGKISHKLVTLSGFYTFTAVVRYTNNTYKGRNKPMKPTYGPAFKRFIERNKLGSVVETRGHSNRCNHPTHIIKVYVWHPNQRAVNKWWRINRGKS